MIPTLTGVGGSSFLPPDVANLGMWLDASDPTTLFTTSLGTTRAVADNDPVGLWRDKSGNGAHVSQSTAASRPLFKTGIFGSSPAILADGSDDYLETLSYSNAGQTAITVYAAVKCVSTGAFQAVVASNPGDGSAGQVTQDGFLLETWTSTRWLLDRLETDPDALLVAQAAAGDFS